MSISEKIATIQQQVAAAHSAITNKGGTGLAGTQNLVSAINSIPAGGGSPGLETPDVYLKVEKLFTMTPADRKQYLNGTWTRDLEWLSLENVPVTFSDGSFSWSGTRALARYTKTDNGKTYYLYVHNFDGYFWDDPTQWNEANIQTFAQFLNKIDELGWMGEAYLYYTFSSTDYTPDQITSYNFESNPEIDPFNAMSTSIDSGLIWNMFGIDEMGMNMGMSYYAYNVTARSSDAISFTIQNNEYSEVLSGWNDTHKGYTGFEKNFQYGRLILNDGVDYLSGKWVGYVDTEDPPWGNTAVGKKREWKHETNDLYAAEVNGVAYINDNWVSYPNHSGFGFMQIPIPSCPRDSQVEWQTRFYTLGNVLFPMYTMRKISVANGGSGYAVGDLIKVNYILCQRRALDWDNDLLWEKRYTDNYLLLCVTSVNETGSVTGVTDMTYDSIDTERLGSRVFVYRAWNAYIYSSDSTAPLASKTLEQASTNGNGTGFTCTMTSKQYGEAPDYTPIFGEERDFYWLACKSLTGNTSDKFPEVYELYRIRTSLSPIQ